MSGPEWRPGVGHVSRLAGLAVALACASFGAAAGEREDFFAFRDAFAAEDLPTVQTMLAKYRRSGLPLPTGEDGTTLLHKAIHVAGERRPQLLRELIAAGADVNARGFEGARPLHLAARFGCARCVPVLLEAGAQLDARDDDGMTPLHQACGSTSDALLDAGADPRARDRQGNVPLHRCLRPGLLVVGVDVRNHAGLTPLHFAALSGSRARIEALIAAGADPLAVTTQASRWSSLGVSSSFGGIAVPAGTTPLALARRQQTATRWNTHTHASAVAALEALTSSRRLF